MLLILTLALCISTTPLPKKCTVIDIENDIVTVQQSENAFAFKGNGYKVGEHITVIMNNNEIKGVL